MASTGSIDTVIFDLDDTLIDWSTQAVSWREFASPRTENVRRYLIECGYDLPPAHEFYQRIDDAIARLWNTARETLIIQSIGEMLKDELTELDVDISTLDMRDLLDRYDWGPFPGVVPFDDTVPVLRLLKSEGYKIGLLTNSFLPMWMRDKELSAYNLISFLDIRLTAADVGCIKPHPEIFWNILRLLHSEASSAVFVGDRPAHDIAGANEAGLTSVLITPPHVEAELDGVRPDFTIKTLSELPPVLNSLN